MPPRKKKPDTTRGITKPRNKSPTKIKNLRASSPTHYLSNKSLTKAKKTEIYNKNEDIINEVLDFIRKPSTLEKTINSFFSKTKLNGLLEHFNFVIKDDINLANEQYNFDYMSKSLIKKINTILQSSDEGNAIKKILYGRIKNFIYSPDIDNNETHFQTFAILIYSDGIIEYRSFDPASGCFPCKKGHADNIYNKQATDEIVKRLARRYKTKFHHIPNEQEIKCQYGISITFAGEQAPLNDEGNQMNITEETGGDDEPVFAFQDVNCQTWCVFLLFNFLKSMNDGNSFYKSVPDNTEERYRKFFNFIDNNILIHNPTLRTKFNKLGWRDLLIHIHPEKMVAVVPISGSAIAADMREETMIGGIVYYKTSRANAGVRKRIKKTNKINKKKSRRQKNMKKNKYTKRNTN